MKRTKQLRLTEVASVSKAETNLGRRMNGGMGG